MKVKKIRGQAVKIEELEMHLGHKVLINLQTRLLTNPKEAICITLTIIITIIKINILNKIILLIVPNVKIRNLWSKILLDNKIIKYLAKIIKPINNNRSSSNLKIISIKKRADKTPEK